MTPEEQSKVYFLLGPWLIGTCLELVLQGVVFCQLAHYISRYQDDYLYTKLVVAGLAVITTLKSIHSLALLWVNFVDDFLDLTTALKLNWLKTYNPLMVSFIGIYCQVWFCHRLWLVSGLWWVVALIATLMLLGFIAVILATYYMTLGGDPKVGIWFATHMSSVFAGDLLLSLTMIFFLLKKKKEVVRKTANLLSALVRLTFQSALPAAICASLNLIFSQLYPGTEKLISTGFNQMLAKLYAISMLWTLNARQNMRRHLSETTGTPMESTDVSVKFAKYRHGLPVKDQEIELGSLGTAGVKKDTEITEDSEIHHQFTQNYAKLNEHTFQATV